MKRLKQSYMDRMDESLGERHRRETKFKQSLKDRRHEAMAMEKKGHHHHEERHHEERRRHAGERDHSGGSHRRRSHNDRNYR